jgi:hypothetical protein
MPYIEFKTNTSLDHNQKELLKSKTAEILAASFPGKTENWLMIRFDSQSDMYFGGSDAPCMMIDVSIFGAQKSSGYDKMTSSMCTLISNECGIPENKVYIKYTEYDKWGWNGGNF